MGVFEVPGFSKGTFKIAHAVAENAGAISIVGGGDSVAAVKAVANVAGQDHAYLHRLWGRPAGVSGRTGSCSESRR